MGAWQREINLEQRQANLALQAGLAAAVQDLGARQRSLDEAHVNLFAELAAYDPHRYMSLERRLTLWGLKVNGNDNGHHFGDHDLLTEQWRKGDSKPIEENLTLILEALHRILLTGGTGPCHRGVLA